MTDNPNKPNSRKADEELLAALHAAVAEELLSRVRHGEMTAAEMAVAVKFLKDNGITAVIAPDSPLKSLTDELDLPFDADGRPV